MALRVGIVWNPTKVDEDALRGAVADELPDADVQWWETAADDPGRAMAEHAVDTGCDIVIAVGGDGTVRSVAEVLAAAADAPALGIVPRGTGNLLARNLGIPLGSIAKALTVVSRDHRRPIDVGWVRADEDEDETAFLVMIGFGLDAHMLAETDDDLKSKAGWLAYVEAMGRALTEADTVDFTLTIDGGSQQDARAHTLLIGNCGAIQGGVTLLPDAVPDDGRLDLLLVSAENTAQWMETLRTVVWDNGIRRMLPGADNTVSTDSAAHFTATDVAVALEHEVRFEIDGEEVGSVSSLRVRVQPAGVQVLC